MADGELPDRAPSAEDIELALANYTSVAEQDPAALWAISGRAELYQMAGRAAEALADYSQIVTSVPSPGWAMCRRAEILALNPGNGWARIRSSRAATSWRS